ncbi:MULTISPECIES: hypothetical protein [unclassified Yoonia]|uniref:hypothetical protein n=1 Tax=unclassified Yoonia TaxID=2629118 RepID=UPI002AFF5551|nr:MULTISPECIES: hypothetical protein [unclassified Yoonia]
MRCALLALIMICWPVTLLAQPVVVRTGEHGNFTRVVVELPAGAAWDFGRGTDGYVLRLAVADGFDLNRFFDLIPRTRIRAVSQDAALGELRLALNCECRADVFISDTAFLVIDIANGAADPDSRFEQALAPPPAAPAGVLPVILPRAGPTPTALPFGSDRTGWSNAPRQPQMPAVTGNLTAMEQLVVESLGRGLSAGVLDPDPLSLPTAAPSLVQDMLPISLPGLAVRDNADPFAIPQNNATAQNADGLPCTPDAFVDLATWADDRPFGAQLAQARSDLIHEFDRFDPEAVEKLARLYLHFGFGREAVQALALDGVRSQERQYLRLLATIIDDDPVTFPDRDQQLSCPSQVALWAFLARPVNDMRRDYDRNAILRAFKNLPLPLQRHLGPRLAAHFTADDDHDAAQQALAMAQNTPVPTVATRLAAATLATQQGDDAAALQTLAEIAQGDPRITPEAMTRYLTEAVQQNQPVPADKMTLADTLRFEYANTPAAGALAAAQVQAYLAGDNFAQAAALLADELAALGPDRHAALSADYAQAAADRMTDADFLTFAVVAPPGATDPALQDNIARRLITLGFPDQALRVLGNAPALPGSERIYLQSKAFLALRDPEAALRLLRDDSSDQAGIFRQAARAMQAGNDTALTSLVAPDSTETNWRNSNWASLAQTGDPLIADAVAAMLDFDGPAFDGAQPLTSGRALLDQAAQSRAMLDGLLDRFASPEEF